MTNGLRSARRRLLGRRQRRHGEWTQLALELGEVQPSASGGPVARAELEEVAFWQS